MTATDQPVDTVTAVNTIIHVPAQRLASHPDNVRASLGDLRDLTQSIKAQGVIVPLLVLPAGDDGMHLIVAGHRRQAAGTRAGLTEFPVMVRDLTPSQVLDAMLVENSQRADLTLAESIRAVARYQSLDPTDTATKIARRIGRSAGWVKSRLALAVLPAQVLAMLDTGTLTLAQAEAVATLVERGDDTMRACADDLASSRSWRQADEQVELWIKDRDAAARHDEVVAKLDRLGVRRFDSTTDANAARAVTLDTYGLGLDKTAARAHRHEPCHAVVVQRRSGDVVVASYCTEPKRHRATASRPAASEIAVERPGEQSKAAINETERACRQARKSRHAAAVPLLAKARYAKGEGLQLAARVWCETIGQHAANKACEFLGVETTSEESNTFGPRDRLVGWLDNGGDPARLLVAFAGAELETFTRQADPLPGNTKADASALWLDLLVRYGGYTADGFDLP